jgi:hypothetical protein
MSSLHQNHAAQAFAHQPDTLVGYLALQRQVDLARAAARSTPRPLTPTRPSTALPAHAPAVGARVRDLLSRSRITRRPAQSELACCA